MRTICFIVAVCLLLAGCQPQANNASNAAFKKNSEIVKSYLKGFQSENVDYSIYADNFLMRDTGFGSKDTVTMDQMKASDKGLWAAYDFKLLGDSVVLLPGVSSTTKMPDGSVRYYGDWEVTRAATDSTTAKTGVVKLYESFDFDDNGKIILQQAYGDFSGIMMYLNSK